MSELVLRSWRRPAGPRGARLGRAAQRVVVLALPAGLLLGFIGIPVVRLVALAAGSGAAAIGTTLGDPLVGAAIANSLWTAGLVAVLGTAVGMAAAIATERLDLPRPGWLRAGILLPLMLPPFVTAFGWSRAYGPRGLLHHVAGLELPGLFGPVGIVLVLTASAAPVAWLIGASALAARVEPDLERAARASGAGAWTALRTVTLPLLRPAILSSLIVGFVFGMNAFGVPAVLGTPAGFATITTRMYEDLARSSDPATFAEAGLLAVTLVVVALAVVGPADAWLTGRPARRHTATGGSGAPIARRSRTRIAVWWLVAAVIVLVAVVPLVATILTALTRAVGLDPVPANWTLANFAEALDRRLADGLVHSLELGVAAATIVVPLGALVAVAARRRGGRVLRSAATLGFAVPGSALAIAVLLAYGPWLRNSLAIILVAYVAKLWALGQRQVAGSLDRLPPDAARAARASGAGPLDALASVVAPLLRPALLGAWLIVFLFALHELTMSSLLYGPRSATLAVVVLNAQQLGDPTVSAALATILVGIVGAVAIPVALLARRSAQ